jgi:hypothetical protein
MTARNLTTMLLGTAMALAIPLAARGAEPNNSIGASTPLPGGQRVVSDALDGNSGRPDTILGHYNPAFSVLYDSNNDGSPMGNGKASQLLGVPVLTNGGAYFRVTGAPDAAFIKNHAQAGRYKVMFDVRDPQGNLVPGKSFVEYEEVSPFQLDNIWMNPSASPDPGNPTWTGFTVDVTVDNIVGAGTGDSLDFFTFAGFQPFEPFTAELSQSDFPGLIGWFSAPNVLVAASDPQALVPTLSGVADEFGRVTIGVTGIPDLGFLGEHAEVGNFTLSIVPEPSSAMALGLGAMLVGWYLSRAQANRRRTGGASDT